MSGIEIIIRGPHNTGRTTAAFLIQQKLREVGYDNVTVDDTKSLHESQKPDITDRFYKNREKPVRIKVELVE